MSKDLAPILIIAFNRPNHFKKTLLALCQNEKANDSILYISIDGPRNEEDKKAQIIIFDHIKLAEGFFAKIKILRNDTNKGLRNNVIDSVSKVLSSHNKIIVLEDDLITSKAFLGFMNDALNFYQNKNKIWQISGYGFINDKNKKDEIYLSRAPMCWGWGTWNDRWKHFDKDPNKLIKTFSKEMIYKFNLDGEANLWEGVISNKLGRKNTWHIFWYSTIFLNSGLCVIPYWTYIKNIGFDDQGINCRTDNKKHKVHADLMNEYGKFVGIDNLQENKNELKKLQRTNNRTFLKSFLIKTFNNLFGYNFSYKFKNFLRIKLE